MFKAGDEIISMDDVYGGSRRYFSRIAGTVNFPSLTLTLSAPQGMVIQYCDMSNPANLESVISEKTKLVWIETPTNPTLKLVDIEAVCKIAHKHSALVVVDNTFLSPYFQRPLELGADMVLHSVSKYLNGHSDVIMGIIAGRDRELEKRLRFVQNGMGAIPSPFDSFLALRGLKTLHIRMERHAENAMAVAKFLEAHPKGMSRK